jgi:hypothetical protein
VVSLSAPLLARIPRHRIREVSLLGGLIPATVKEILMSELERERAAKNQSLFREVNERIEDLASPVAPAGFICECLNTECDQQISLSVEEYERVRSGSNRFLVVPGHQVAGVEEVVGSSDRYLVVAKLGVGGQVAAGLDPRQRNGPSR